MLLTICFSTLNKTEDSFLYGYFIGTYEMQMSKNFDRILVVRT